MMAAIASTVFSKRIKVAAAQKVVTFLRSSKRSVVAGRLAVSIFSSR